jgi:PIN domain nuclease of toxin-antitoxin system
MNALLDTHAFLWFVSGEEDLSETAKRPILDAGNTIAISIASLWEISIKTALGKLRINGEYASVIEDVIGNDIEIMPITFKHTVLQHQLPFYHRDPFDRIIVSQALTENYHLISKDAMFDHYLENGAIKRIW